MTCSRRWRSSRRRWPRGERCALAARGEHGHRHVNVAQRDVRGEMTPRPRSNVALSDVHREMSGGGREGGSLESGARGASRIAWSSSEGGHSVSDRSAIEWTDATWNPVRGRTKVSPGCKHCYAETFAYGRRDPNADDEPDLLLPPAPHERMTPREGVIRTAGEVLAERHPALGRLQDASPPNGVRLEARHPAVEEDVALLDLVLAGRRAGRYQVRFAPNVDGRKRFCVAVDRPRVARSAL